MLSLVAQYVLVAVIYLLFPSSPSLDVPQFVPKEEYPLQFAILEESEAEEGIGRAEMRFRLIKYSP